MEVSPLLSQSRSKLSVLFLQDCSCCNLIDIRPVIGARGRGSRWWRNTIACACHPGRKDPVPSAAGHVDFTNANISTVDYMCAIVSVYR